MLYYLLKFFDKKFDIIGGGLIHYISFRAAAASITSLFISIVFGKKFINLLASKQIYESHRDLPVLQDPNKQQIPTMGGLIIISAILIPTLLFAKVLNIYIILLLTSTLWMGLIGFLDDYIKIFKQQKKGLMPRYKLVGQIILGILVGSILYFHKDVIAIPYPVLDIDPEGNIDYQNLKTITTIPFLKKNHFNYDLLIPFLGREYTWIIYILVVTFVVSAVSNGTNITDGLDGLATSICAIIGLTLAILAYLSGNSIFANYLNILYIPGCGEIVVFCSAFVGACIGFLWYNAYPAQIFMGDTGSLSLGSIIAVLAFCIKKELLIPLLCGVFVVENLSVVLQVGYFKYTKRKYGIGKRIFQIAPLHHHYQKLNYHEVKIVTRFVIISIILAILTLLTFKIR